MERALIIKDSVSSNVYAIATEKNGSIRIFGTTDPAKEWAEWADAKLQGRGKLQDILKFLDVSFMVDGPKPLDRQLRAQIAQNAGGLNEDVRSELESGRTEKPNEKSALINILSASSSSGPDGRIGRASNPRAKKSLIDYKALAFRNEQSLATFGYDIKKARAVFDPDLAGGNGGWRCPVGTRYGGQITDRYGRGCGWGVARRIANAITDTGQRLERGLDGRRNRTRVGSVRGAVRPKRRGSIPLARTRGGIPERMERLADRVDGGYGRRPRAERRAGQVGERRSRPGGQTGRLGLPERMERAAQDVLQGTYLENRRGRRGQVRERQGSARQRQGVPERMDRAAGEVLEGTFLSNRRRRRAASTQQAQERPRVAATPNRTRTERATQRPSRRTTISVPENPIQERATKLKKETEAPTPVRRGTYRPSQLGLIPDVQNINEEDVRREYEKETRQKIDRATKRANEQVRKAGGDQQKLRELASEANRRAERFRVIAEGTDLRGREEVPMEERIYAVPEMRAANEAAAILRTALEKEVSLNGIDRPSDERIAEMGKEAQKEVKSVLKKRAVKLGEFLKRKYGDGDPPWLAPNRVKAEDWDRLASSSEGRRRLEKFIRDTYELDEFTTPSGLTFKTKVTGSGIQRGQTYIDGRIYVKHPDTGEFVDAGTFSRVLKPNNRSVYHDRLFIQPSRSLSEETRKAVRNSGFAGVFNGHAITWLKGAGFKEAGVSTAQDGPFVWPRLGFRTSSRSSVDAINEAMKTQLENYRTGKKTIIANDRDAAKIEYLLRLRKTTNADIQHNDFILALSNRDDKDQVVRNWFRTSDRDNYERLFSGGDLVFSDDAFPDDPRSLL